MKLFKFFLVAVILAFLLIQFFQNSNTVTALDDLRKEFADLRVQVEAYEASISTMQTDLQQLRQIGLTARKPGGSVENTLTEMGLAERLAELYVQQSNTASLLKSLSTRAPVPTFPESNASQKQASINSLEISLQEQQQKLDAAKQRTRELLLNLNIPAEFSTMEPAKGLDTASLSSYWPYFEAKRERDLLESTIERIRLRLMAERIDAGAANPN
jgi:cell division protein FtsL